jgi:hypothetical protein
MADNESSQNKNRLAVDKSGHVNKLETSTFSCHEMHGQSAKFLFGRFPIHDQLRAALRQQWAARIGNLPVDNVECR